MPLISVTPGKKNSRPSQFSLTTVWPRLTAHPMGDNLLERQPPHPQFRVSRNAGCKRNEAAVLLPDPRRVRKPGGCRKRAPYRANLTSRLSGGEKRKANLAQVI